MVNRTQEYWRNRFERIENLQYNKAQSFNNKLQESYIMTLSSLEKDLNAWYARYASNEGITLDEARKRLTNKELRELKIDVKQYIKLAKQNGVDGRWTKVLESVSARVHITRLEELFIRTTAYVNELANDELVGLTALLGDVYLNQFNRVAHAVQTGTNIAFPLAAIPSDRLDIIIKKPWAVDGLNFSDRIYTDRVKLINVLETELIQAFSLGEGVGKTAKRIQYRLGVSFSQAARLVQTEENAISSRANENSFKELGVEQYQYLATLDSRTSNICQTFDNKVFKLAEYEVGVTAPPLHVNCRSTTVPDIEGAEYERRVARDREGKTVYVPGNYSYADWFKEYGVKDERKVQK